MSNIVGIPRRYDLKYNFQVKIDRVGSADFTTCSEPSVATGEAMLWMGGDIVPIKEPTRLTFADITLERGSSRDMDLYAWLSATSNAALGGAQTVQFKRQVFISQYDRTGNQGGPAEQIRLFNAWPKEYSLGDFNNDADEFRMEKLVISYDYFHRFPIKQP